MLFDIYIYIYIYMDTHLLWLHMELKAASANMSVIQNELPAQDHLMLNVSRAYHNNSVLQRLNVRCLASVLFHCRSRDLSSSREPTHWPVRSETWEYSPCIFSITNTYILQVYWLQLHQYEVCFNGWICEEISCSEDVNSQLYVLSYSMLFVTEVWLNCVSETVSLLLAVTRRPDLTLLIEPFKTCSVLVLVLRCEPSTY